MDLPIQTLPISHMTHGLVTELDNGMHHKMRLQFRPLTGHEVFHRGSQINAAEEYFRTTSKFESFYI